MKFLIDECLHTSLVAVAHEAGFACDHVNFLGLGGWKDWQLMERIRADEFTFVTNNRTDFGRLYAKEELHAGLVIIIPNATPSLQRDLFRAAVTHIDGRSLVNTVIEVDFAGTAIRCREYRRPAEDSGE